MTTRTTNGADGARRAGFTLIELLVVISIIVALAAMTTAVGVAVVKRNKANVTESLLTTLDRALEEYLAVAGTPPKYVIAAYRGVPGPDNEPEPYRQSEHMRRPDAAVFLKQARGVGQVDEILKSIPDRFLFVTPEPQGASGGAADPTDVTPSIIDGWGDSNSWDPIEAGRPWPVRGQQIIYFVHPDNELAQDLYGRCVNRRPYFMSAGPDKEYGAGPARGSEGPNEARQRLEAGLADNLYSYEGVAGTHRPGLVERVKDEDEP